MRVPYALAFVAAASIAFGCATYLDDLNRAEAHTAANEHEAALALFRTLEPNLDSLSPSDQTRYCYLRGINDYRLGGAFRTDARHWLALAQSLEQRHSGSLRPEWKAHLAEALQVLNQEAIGAPVPPATSASSSPAPVR